MVDHRQFVMSRWHVPRGASNAWKILGTTASSKSSFSHRNPPPSRCMMIKFNNDISPNT